MISQEQINGLMEQIASGSPNAIGKLIGVVDGATYEKMRQDHEQQTTALIAAAAQDDPMFVIEALKMLREMNKSEDVMYGVVAAAIFSMVHRAMELERSMVHHAPDKLKERLFSFDK